MSSQNPCTREEELHAMHRAAVDSLTESGLQLAEEQAIEELRAAGCLVERSGRVRFPSTLIEQAIAAAPRRIELFSRAGESRMRVGSGDFCLGTGIDVPHTLDVIHSERRDAVLADVTAFARLADALAAVDLVGSMARSPNARSPEWDRQAFLTLAENTTKPMLIGCGGYAALEEVIRLAVLVAGGESALAAQPFFMVALHPGRSGSIDGDFLACSRLLIDTGIPLLVAADCDQQLGAGTAGAASLLGALVVAQIHRPGAAILLGDGATAQPGISRWPSPLVGLMDLYGLPVCSFAGVSGSKLPDIQAGIECALSMQAARIRGVYLTLGAGFLESGALGSFEMVVIADAIARLIRGQTPADVDSPLPLFDRRSHADWIESGRPNMIRSARDRAIELIGSHQVTPLTGPIRAELSDGEGAVDRSQDSGD